MDPLTALGLAGNIVQFIDFAWKLFEGTKAIYKSASGSSHDNAVLQSIANDLRHLSNGIIISNQHSEELRRLATESKRISLELLDALEKLKLQGRNTKWKSFVLALREAWSRGKINEMSDRLSALQSQMNLHIQIMVRALLNSQENVF
ncbi:uncharacterized protein LY89DRAFT_685948 [Mollisia scopiformis]|uniref:NACHT-NTPase and P-loop NTPases N-terminal domain-containing protein n=1 Tax=Mollisia scopiformis TaxID=149040 RepID=A0A194X4M4_MOLSC|nr:uncharacterized protein LY89DRAFT_685948 [Mollisia scopiformis]KUJ15133.1 hypothetical protein LY89DRAFT_685948 [Mollisia scopiformis]